MRDGQAIHSNGPQTGSQRPGVHTPTSGAPELGGHSVGVGETLLHPTHPHRPVGSGTGDMGPLPDPPSHTSKCEEGEPLPVSEGGSKRAGHQPKVNQHSRD